MKPTFKTYLCRVRSFPEQAYVAASAGKAKAQCFNDVRESWPDIKYTDINVRCTGELRTDGGFISNARYRDIEFAYIGMRVTVGALGMGTIVGHNSSANLSVVFDNRPDVILSCHPHCEIAYFDDAGAIVRDYRTVTSAEVEVKP